MASASAPCRKCDRSSSRCDGCHRLFCDYHLSEHRQNLTEQIDNLITEYSNLKEILALPPSYESLTESTELINKINQWEIDTIQQIKEIAEQTREKVRRRSNTITSERFEPEFQQLTTQLQQNQRTNHFTELDIERLTTQLNNLKIQIEDSLLTTADIRTTPIDWIKYLEFSVKQQKIQRNIHFDRLITTKARISLCTRGGDWHVLGTPSPINSTFLHYQHTLFYGTQFLSLVDVNGQQKSIPWFEDQSVWDSCWSSFLNKFIILCDNRLYTYDDQISTSYPIQLIKSVRSKRDKVGFLRCTCSDENIFITYNEHNTSIDEYNMNQWTIVHEYQNIVKQNEKIISIATSETNSNLIGIILEEKRCWHFELRNRSMLLISLIQLDKSEYSRQLISLPNSNMNWLIVHASSKLFTIISENGQTKQMIECAENMELATYIPKNNCLVVLTEKDKLKFFDL